jgi:3-hydroxybutyrate dehydrogenase
VDRRAATQADSDQDLAGKVSIVTGAAGTIGTAIADVFRERGATVVGVDVRGDDCLHADISTAEGNEHMIDWTLEQHGRLDVLVLNAGLQHISGIGTFPVERWDKIFDTVVRGPFLAMRHAWAELTSEPGRRIVVTASPSSVLGEPLKSAYCAAKHAVYGLVKVAAVEGGPLGLTVNAVGPGWVLSNGVQRQLPKLQEIHGLSRDEVMAKLVDRQPVKRFLDPREIAQATAFLASERASGVNGHLLEVDLGASIAW